MRFFYAIQLLFIFITSWTTSALPVTEALGHLYIQDVLVRPNFLIQKSQGGEFSLGESSFALQWSNDDIFSSYIMIGPRSLVNIPEFYINSNTYNPDQFTFVEAYGRVHGAYGEFRLGMIPLEYGAEGQLRESEIIFPRSLIFQTGIVGLRDLGASYGIKNEGFFTRFAVHNGEGGKNLDGRLWYTAAWGWSNENDLEVGAMGQTGSTTPASTANSSTQQTLAGLDPTRNARFRLMGLFLKWYPRRWKIILEGTGGEVLQGAVNKFYVGHIDAIYDLSPSFSGLFRYDELNPNSSPNDHTRQVSVGVGFRASHDTIATYLIGTQIFTQDQSNSDQLLLVLRLTPLPMTTLF